MKRKDLLFYILLLLISIPVSAGWQRPGDKLYPTYL